jgi:hypothetical protein
VGGDCLTGTIERERRARRLVSDLLRPRCRSVGLRTIEARAPGCQCWTLEPLVRL